MTTAKKPTAPKPKTTKVENPAKPQVATAVVTKTIEDDTNYMLAVKRATTAIQDARKKYGYKVVLAWDEVDTILKSIEGALKI